MTDREPRGVAERVLVVEDDPATRVGLTELVRTWGFHADCASDGEEALEKVTTFRPAIVVTDLVMPRMDGLQLLHALQDQDSDVSLVILTAQGTVETAVEAIKAGAYDYLTKPVDPQRLRILLDKVVERQETLREVKVLRRQLREHGSFGRLVGNSAGMRKIYRTIEQAAPTDTSVLISGESGTGKELVAQTIHQLSPRAGAPYVPINCAAIPETLLESEIFGHERGAFTGAVERRQGCFELADHGTLFLDEVAEMTPTTQVKLLRVLRGEYLLAQRDLRGDCRRAGHRRRRQRPRARRQADACARRPADAGGGRQPRHAARHLHARGADARAPPAAADGRGRVRVDPDRCLHPAHSPRARPGAPPRHRDRRRRPPRRDDRRPVLRAADPQADSRDPRRPQPAGPRRVRRAA
jgi:CheY-like chemotaxis protein